MRLANAGNSFVADRQLGDPSRFGDAALGGHGELGNRPIGAAVLAPGESTGVLTIRENLSVSGGGQLWMALGGLLWRTRGDKGLETTSPQNPDRPRTSSTSCCD